MTNLPRLPSTCRSRTTLASALIALALGPIACGVSPPETGTRGGVDDAAAEDTTSSNNVGESGTGSGGGGTDAAGSPLEIVPPPAGASVGKGVTDADGGMPTTDGASAPASPDAGNTDDGEASPGETSGGEPSGGETSVEEGVANGDGGNTPSEEEEAPVTDIATRPPVTDEAVGGDEDDEGEAIGCGATAGRALALINAVRAEARFCGDERFEAAEPLGWDSRLRDAALDHSTDMATHNFLDHTGSDGSSVSVRVERHGYDRLGVAENIAAGQSTIEKAVSGWTGSPGHCRNLMNPRYRDVAVACVDDADADYGRYWTNVLARPR